MGKRLKISEYVRNRRGNRSVLDYSKELGISNTQLARIEKGFWDEPSSTQVNNLCKIFGLTIEDLDIFEIPEEILAKSFMYKYYEYKDIVHKCISNFYYNAKFNNKTEFRDLYKEPEFEEIRGIDLKFLFEDIEAICVSKDNKSDYIPFYFIDYKRTSDNELFNDYDSIVRKYYSNFVCTLSRMMLNGKIKKAIIITNSKSSYDILDKWFNEIPCFSINKEVYLAYCSIKNKGCEYYLKKL